MQKALFLGTDLHNSPSELAAKLVRSLKKEGRIISIANRKEFCRTSGTTIVPRFSDIDKLRKILQGIVLPFYLMGLRASHKKIFTFWNSGKYQYLLFKFLKLLGYKIYFTVISGYDKDYSCLSFCDVVICQSKKMQNFLKKKFPDKEKKIIVIRPGIDLEIFKPKKKQNIMVIPSVPYKVKDFEERGINILLEIIKKQKIKTRIIFRSEESYNHLKGMNIPNTELINRVLSNKELADILCDCKIMPIIYSYNSPDMPLSAIEGLACGCSIICTDNIGLTELISKTGIVVRLSKESSEILSVIKRLMKERDACRKNRDIAEKNFDKKTFISGYIKMIRA